MGGWGGWRRLGSERGLLACWPPHALGVGAAPADHPTHPPGRPPTHPTRRRRVAGVTPHAPRPPVLNCLRGSVCSCTACAARRGGCRPARARGLRSHGPPTHPPTVTNVPTPPSLARRSFSGRWRCWLITNWTRATPPRACRCARGATAACTHPPHAPPSHSPPLPRLLLHRCELATHSPTFERWLPSTCTSLRCGMVPCMGRTRA